MFSCITNELYAVFVKNYIGLYSKKITLSGFFSQIKQRIYILGLGYIKIIVITSKVDRNIKIGTYIAYKVLIFQKNYPALPPKKRKWPPKIQNGRQKCFFSSLSSKAFTFLNNIKKQLIPAGDFTYRIDISATFLIFF